MEPKDIKQAVIDGVNEAKKPLEEKFSKVEEKLAKIDDVVARVEAIEKAPAQRQQAPAVISSKIFKGYNLNKQGRFIKNQSAKLKSYMDVLHTEEAQEEMTKYFINLNLAFRGDQEARKELLQIAAKAAYNEGTTTQGGFLVPDEYAMDLIMLSRDRTFSLEECNVFSMSTDTKRIPKESVLPTVSWTAENGTMTANEGTFGELALTAKKLTALSVSSNEMLADSSIDIASMLSEQFSYGMALELDNQVLNGTGDPVSGVLTAAAGYSVVMTGLINFSSITADNLSNLISKIDEGFVADAKFIFNKDIMHFIRTLKDTTNNYIFAKPGNGVPGSIWEYPYRQSSKAPLGSTTGTGKAFVAFGNFKLFYIARRVGSMVIEADPYSLFTSDKTQFRMITRWGMGIAAANGFSRLVTG